MKKISQTILAFGWLISAKIALAQTVTPAVTSSTTTTPTTAPTTAPATTKILPGGDPTAYTARTVIDLIKNIVQVALGFAGVVAFIYILLSAFQYFTAYGNEEKAEAAKRTLLWAIIGFIIIGISFAIVTYFYSKYAPSANTYINSYQ